MTFTDSDATRILQAVDTRIDRKIKSGALVSYTWGSVYTVATDAKSCSVMLYGETDGANVSTDFRVPGSMTVAVDDSVRVAIDYSTGDRWIEEVSTPKTLRENVRNGVIQGKSFNGFGYVTSNTGATYNTQWTKIMSGQVPTQYADASGDILISNTGNSVATGPRGRIRWRVKQQAAFGSQPYVSVELDGMLDLSDDDVVMLITSVAGPTTFELWVRINVTYTTIMFHPLHDYQGSAMWNTYYEANGFSASIPAGTQYPASYAWITGGAIRANFGNDFTVGSFMISAKGTTVGHTADYIWGIYENATYGAVMQFGDGSASGTRDVTLYRMSANVLGTDDEMSANTLRARANGVQNLFVGDDASFGDANVVHTIALKSQTDANQGALQLGADVNIYRYSANILATDDNMIVFGNLEVGASGAGNGADGVAFSGGNIEMRNSNPFIDFKTTNIDFGARIIYDYGVADGLEFTGATGGYTFDAKVSASGEAWTSVTFTNSWVDYGGYAPTAYRKDANGYVHLRGLIKSGTLGSSAFTLPTGYRPYYNMIFMGHSNVSSTWGLANNGRFDVASTGTVTPHATLCQNGYVSLEGVTFLAEG
jgi:hypothetical protein